MTFSASNTVNSLDISELERAVKERTLMLEHEVEERRKSERLQNALFRISELALLSMSRQEKFARLKEIMSDLMYVPNFMVTVYHEETKEFAIEYCVDEVDASIFPGMRFPYGKGITSYIAKHKQARLFSRSQLQELSDAGEIDFLDKFAIPHSWLGAPLIVEDVLYGAIIVQSYNPKELYDKEDFNLIEFVAIHIATSFARIHADEKRRIAQEELKQQNERLNQALIILKDAQSDLVEQEKLASLGRLVAGVAHEINTPLGICVTATSNMVEEVSLLKKALKNGELTEEYLEEFFNIIDQSLKIMTTNSQRSALLVKSFKQVAVDQSSESLRKFDIRAYLDEVLLSLQPRMKKSKIVVRVECPPNIIICTYAGAISQVITNMVINSLVHGFDGREGGDISIEITKEEDHLHLNYSDNGNGMSEYSLSRIFEPFYTTKRGQGGSGLGAHIIYNLVTGPLGGTIKAKSTEGKGLQYYIRIPLTLKPTGPAAA